MAGEVIGGETFGVVEDKAATALGPLLAKSLIRMDAMVRRGLSNVSLSIQANSMSVAHILRCLLYL